MRSSILSQFGDLGTGVICSVFGFQLLREQGSYAVIGDDIFVFAVSLGNVQGSSDNRCCIEVESVPDAAKVADMIVASTG